MNPRNGKIARLPRFIRDELNERLEGAEEGPQLLAWLNALPEVKELVQNDFAGVPVSKQNLSEWRQGGFQEWLARRDLCEEARNLAVLGEDMADECDGGVLADRAATVLAVRFGSLIAKWDGEVDAKFEAKTRVLNRLCRSVVQLQHGMHRARREALEVDRIREENDKREKAELQERLTAPFFDTLKVGPMAKVFGGGEKGWKIANYIVAIQSGRLDAELDVLPTDKFDEPEPEPVKPKAKRAVRKTRNKRADKPLQENEMEDETDGEPGQSNRIKPIWRRLMRINFNHGWTRMNTEKMRREKSHSYLSARPAIASERRRMVKNADQPVKKRARVFPRKFHAVKLNFEHGFSI